ncbi:RTA1 like protein-domain-containing protein [Podospora didyma]|uniref:RTA1 like protein-domain-containing protein n=1 Tax=Podospora didyma TaxID=330526 RepID=A0AAE0NU87_9PEZI|nr:RTA1 like protein-domain-containing protein [Podospora didyma]
MSCETGIPDWSNVTFATFNQTLLMFPRLCTACTCPLTIEGWFLGYMAYFPSLAGNAVFAAIFGVFLLVQLYFGVRFKTWGFLISMGGGLILEVLGYVGRILMRDNMFTNTYFIMYLVCLTIGPAFLSAAVYLTLSRLVVIYAPDRSRFRPQVYTYIFIAMDIVALILQAAGGGVASLAAPYSAALKAGVNTMVAGVAWQVFSLAVFALLSLEFWLRVRKAGEKGLNPAFADLRAERNFQPTFIVAVFGAGVFIFVRSVFRCAELSGGFTGPLANEEITFMVLEGTMIVLASGLLTFFHPGFVAGTERWAKASWKAARKPTIEEGVSERSASSGDADKTPSKTAIEGVSDSRSGSGIVVEKTADRTEAKTASEEGA